MADSKISGLTAKAVPVGADTTVIVDSADLLNKKITLDNLPTTSTVQNALDGKVELTGDTMTGPLQMTDMSENIQFSILGLNATANLNLKTDDDSTRPTGDIFIKSGNAINSDYAGSIYLEGGSNVDGNPANIQITAGSSSGTGSNGSIILDSKNIVYLNQSNTGSIDASNHRLENVADPTSSQDAATRNWVETVSSENGTLFVDSTASLFGADGSAFKPFVTLADALAVAVDNDVIIVRPGSYTEAQVVIPGTISYLTIKGQSSGSTNITSGFSYTPTAGASIDINFFGLNVNQLTLDAAAAPNGLVSVKNCSVNLNRIDTNPNVLLSILDCVVAGGSTYSSATITLSLLTVPIYVYDAFVFFDGCKFVTTCYFHDTAKARLINCQHLYGLGNSFIQGIANTATPEVEIDTTSDYLGIITGDFTKTGLASLPDYLKKSEGGTITGEVEISSLPGAPILGNNLKLVQGDVGYQPEFINIQKLIPSGATNNAPFYAIRSNFNCSEPNLTNTIYLLDSNINVPDVAGDVVYQYYNAYIAGTMTGYYCNIENYFNVGENTGGTWDYYSRYSCADHSATLNGFDLSCNVTNMSGSISGVNFTINSSNYTSSNVKIFDTNSNINFTGSNTSEFTGVHMKPTISGDPASTIGGLFDMSSCTGTGVTKALKTVGDSEFTGNLLNTGDIEATGVIKGQLNMQGSAPTASNDPGVPGDIRFDSTDLYVCVAANTWKKVALSTF